jgi:hypothetical protein
VLHHLINRIPPRWFAIKILRFFADRAAKKWLLRGSLKRR